MVKWKVSEYATSKYALWYIGYFKLEALEKWQMQGEAFFEPLLSVWRQVLQKELDCYKSPPGEFHQPAMTDSS